MAARFRAFSSIAAVVALSACDAGESGGSAVLETMKPSWFTLDDGSQFAIVTHDDAGSANTWKTGVRCWPDGSRQLCLYVQETDLVGRSIEVSFSRQDELPGLILPGSSGNGYSCRMLLGAMTEEIEHGSAKLISNTIDHSSSAWSRKYVTDFMADNKVDGEWFDCGRLVRVMQGGSLQTMATTAITRAMLPE